MIASKMAKIGDRWERISLTDREVDDAIERLIKINAKILLQTAQVESMIELPELSKEKIIELLFERHGISSFTYLSNTLDEKIDKLKIVSWGKPYKEKAKEPTEPIYKPPMEEKKPVELEEYNPFETPKMPGEEESNEYEEIKMPKEKAGGFLRR
jgi:uncharacterized protein YkvS